MRLLVIGASGLVGSHLLAEARSRQIEAVGTYRTHPNGGLVPLDLADTHGAISLLDRLEPTAVIHAAGWTWADGCERDPARSFRENTEQPGKIAQLCAERGIRMVYISSSYVFDGCNGPYTEDAVTRPINVYGQSKRAGEEAVWDFDVPSRMRRACTVIVSVEMADQRDSPLHAYVRVGDPHFLRGRG